MCQLLHGYFEKHIGKSQQETDFCVLNGPALLQLKTGGKKEKEKKASLPSRIFSAAPASLLLFLRLPPQPCYKPCEFGTTGANMKYGCSVFRPLLLGRAFIKIFCLAENTCSSYSETQNILLLMTLGVCLPSVGGGEGEGNRLQWEGSCTSKS